MGGKGEGGRDTYKWGSRNNGAMGKQKEGRPAGNV